MKLEEISTRVALFLLICIAPVKVHAEGRCPPDQYPIGDERAPGCAPIPGGQGAATQTSPAPTGKWETRWGAIAENAGTRAPGVPLATGVSESRKSRREAVKVALAECKAVGGENCQVSITYNNQCVALADPTAEQLSRGAGKSFGYSAETVVLAKSLAMKACEGSGGGQSCRIIYSACSMPEFRSFR